MKRAVILPPIAAIGQEAPPIVEGIVTYFLITLSIGHVDNLCVGINWFDLRQHKHTRQRSPQLKFFHTDRSTMSKTTEFMPTIIIKGL